MPSRIQPQSPGDLQAALALLRRSDLGCAAVLETPFGRRRLCYADMTASGRFLTFVEDWIGQLLPYYANTHTLISTTGKLLTDLREEARAVVGRAVGAAPGDVVMFVGSGATGAVNKLVGLLGLAGPAGQDRPREQRPLVIVGPYEHHSNLLPWFESVAEVQEVAETPRGEVDLGDLQRRLVAARTRPMIVGSFSAASNVTGILTDVRAVTRLLKRHGALACFDYAACGPYAPIDMHPADEPGVSIDALFVSTHKFAGGAGGSGVLVASPACFRRSVPERPGGGTVSYVSSFDGFAVDYVPRLEEREEGGTPNIVGDLRAGIAFLVKELVGARPFLAHETEMARAALARLSRHPRIRFLGSLELPRLPILSFNIVGLHHDFASTLLDHLFGIQNRAGCACAGPYGHRLLGVGQEESEAFRTWIQRGILGVKPGWVRVTLPPYASPADVDFVLAAIEFVADYGEDFLAAYELDWRDGVWRARGLAPPAPPIRLSPQALLAAGGPPPVAPHRADDEEALAIDRALYFEAAHRLAAEYRADSRGLARDVGTGDAELDRLVWFHYIHSVGTPGPVG